MTILAATAPCVQQTLSNRPWAVHPRLRMPLMTRTRRNACSATISDEGSLQSMVVALHLMASRTCCFRVLQLHFRCSSHNQHRRYSTCSNSDRSDRGLDVDEGHKCRR